MAILLVDLLQLLLLLTATATATIDSSPTPPCTYTSIFAFGDSLTDTGNLAYHLASKDELSLSATPPYGVTTFHHPTGRFSDGRLIVDFLAEAMQLPFLPPFLSGGDFRRGANFASARATALENEYYKRRGIKDINTWNNSLPVQTEWFKEMHRSLCSNASSSDNCIDLSTSLFIMGEIGGNDYHHSMTDGVDFEDIRKRVPDVIKRISSAIQVIVEHGARTVLVPGNIPMGCQPVLLAYYSNSGEGDYDGSTGCISWLNVFSEYHNKLLQDELHRLRRRFPDTSIIYVDYYNAVMSLYRSPQRFGFSGSLRACCGNGGGLYNYNSSCRCGAPGAGLCSDPSRYVSWDGVHLTEAAYKMIASGVLEGSYTSPRFPVAGPCHHVSEAATQSNSVDLLPSISRGIGIM